MPRNAQPRIRRFLWRPQDGYQQGGSPLAACRHRGIDGRLDRAFQVNQSWLISSFPLDEDDRQDENNAEGGEAEQLRRLPPAAYVALVRITRSRIRDTPD